MALGDLEVLQNKLDVPQFELHFSSFLSYDGGLPVCPQSQNSISNWGTSSLFCNTAKVLAQCKLKYYSISECMAA